MMPDTLSELQEAINAAHRQGFSVIPIEPNSKKPAFDVLPRNDKGDPVWEPFQRRRPTKEELKTWFEPGGRNLGIVCGSVSGGLFVLDIDDSKLADEMAADVGLQFETTMCRTPGRGGLHIYAIETSATTRTEQIVPGVADLKAEGGYVLAPPSSINGRSYTHLTNGTIMRVLDGRAWAAETLRAFGVEVPDVQERKPVDVAAVLEGVPEGERDEELFRAACKLRHADVPRDYAEKLILDAAAKCSPPFPKRDALAKVASAYGYPPGRNGVTPEGPHHEDGEDEPDEHLTDWGNAQRLVRLHGDELRYCHAWGKWLIWDKRRWRTDDTGRIYRLAKSTVKTIYAEAKAATDGDVRKAIASWAMRSEAQARLEAMTVSAQSEPGIPVRPEDLDADPWLFNVQNGSIDLRTGALRPHDPADLITKVGDVEFDAEAKAPVFDAFLDRIMAGDEELIEYQKRTLGRSLTGDVSEHRIELWHGPGANGKSTLTTAMLGVMGDYGLMAAPGLLLKRRQDAHPTEVADLKGARFVSSVEVGEFRKLNEEGVKQLSGGDRLKARYMRQDFWEFEPTHKLFVACNHRPTIVGSDHAIWRRVRLVPFSVVIPDEDQDKGLGEKLKTERAGILNWLIEGCLAWKAKGLTEPEAVSVATSDYRAEQDLVAAFVAECCTINPNAKALSADLYNTYAEWCKDSHEEALSKRAFGLRLGDQGFTADRKGHGGKRCWFGIGLSTQQTFDSEQG